jgi:hypothetical protein
LRGVAARPSIDSLEQRAMLDAAMPHLAQGPPVPTDVVAAVSRQSQPIPIITKLASAPDVKVTTVPANGELNPYGVAIVPPGFPSGGLIKPGQILVANFNDSGNVQGTGTTIVAITPGQNRATAPVFFKSQAQGLDLALGVLKSGFVIVGNLPTTDGTAGTIGQGSIQIINRFGQVVQTLTDPNLLNWPWGLTVNDVGNTPQIFVSNVVSGTVIRIDLKVEPVHGQITPVVTSVTEIASGYTVQPNSGAVIVGPTGLAYNSRTHVLYVAATGDNEIFAIPNANTIDASAGRGKLVYHDPAHLFGPIGLGLTPNGDLLVTNGDAVNLNNELPSQTSAIAEVTPGGEFLGQFSLDAGAGGAFGFVLYHRANSWILASVDDVTNTLDFRTIRT